MDNKSKDSVNNLVSIYQVNLRLNKTGFKKYVNEFKLKETDKSYMGLGKRIDKDKLLKIDSITFARHDNMLFFTYCKAEQIDEALKILHDHIVILTTRFKEEMEIVYSHINDEIK